MTLNRNGIKVARKERRRDRRRSLQIEASLGGQLVTLTDVSAAGFGAAVDATDRTPYDFRLGQCLCLEISDGRDETPRQFQVEITRTAGANGVLGGCFIQLSDDGYNFIESILTGRLQRSR